jgi:hypothetical protein
MPDPVRFLAAMGLAALVAALAVAIGWHGWRAAESVGPGATRRARALAIVGIGAAWWAGCRLLGQRLDWPPGEALDRLFLVLLPATLGVELANAALSKHAMLVWTMRIALSAAAAPTLLYGSIYISDAAGPGSRHWSTWQSLAIFALFAAALAGVWWLLAKLAGQASARSVVLAAAMCSAAAGVAVMLSGSIAAGQIGLPLAGGLAGAAAASLLMPGRQHVCTAVGPAVVGLFAMVVVGRFFADLTTLHAILLFAALLGCFVSTMPYVRSLGNVSLGACRLAAVAIPLAVIVVQAYSRFAENAASSGDYGAYGATIDVP